MGQECVGNTKQQHQHRELHCMPGFPLFLTPLPIRRRLHCRRDPKRMGRLQKQPVGGSLLAPAGPHGRVHPFTLQLTPTPPTCRRQQKRNIQISISKPHYYKDIKVHALYNARVLLWGKLSVSSKQPHFPSRKWNSA